MADSEDIKREGIGFISWVEQREGKVVALVKIEGPCPRCEGQLATEDIVVGYLEPATHKGYVRKTAELWEANPKLTCETCSLSVAVPMGVVEALTISGEASIKIHRALATLSDLSPN